MRLNLPNIQHGGEDARLLYEAATLKSTHVKQSAYGYGTAGDVAFTLPKMFDPSRRGMFSSYGVYGGELDVLSFDENEEIRKKVLLGCRNIAKTHAVANACVSIYSRFPVQGLKLQHKDPEFERFYTELFLEDLDFENFLIDIGKSFWVDGTVFVYGNWSDSLGLWVGEDLLDPLTMDIRRVPFASEDSVYLIPQDELKEIARGQSPEGVLFRQRFPEMADAINKGEDIPISNDRVIVLANKDRPSDLWGTPQMLRAWNTFRLEDRMNSAMQATADRMYAPLVMFNVGGTLPDGTPMIPSAAMLSAFRDNLDAALASDFRMIVTHSGVTSQEVIRRDTMNSFKLDMDMYDAKVLLAYGLSESILKPQSGTYATSAMELQVATQLMSSYQKMLVSVYNKQAAFVAEAHEHYETDGGEIVTERREVWDEETESYVVKDVPKLSYPRMSFDVINFRDEQKEREFRMALRNAGVPISDNDIAIGVDIDLKDSEEKYQEEQIRKKVLESERETAIMNATMKKGNVVPPDTLAYMEKGIPPFKFKKIVDDFKEKDDDDYDRFDEKLDNHIEDSITDYDEQLEETTIDTLAPEDTSFSGEMESYVPQRPEESSERLS